MDPLSAQTSVNTFHKTDKSPHKFIIPLSVIIFILVLGLIWSKKSNFIPQIALGPTPTTTPVPTTLPLYVIPLATGVQKYNVSSGQKDGPAIMSFVVDPLAVEKGSQQTMSVHVSDKEPVTLVTITLITDNKETPNTLKLVKGTNLDGTWEGIWTIDDTLYFKYMASIVAESARGKSKIDPVFR